jgi:hypothetical protein
MQIGKVDRLGTGPQLFRTDVHAASAGTLHPRPCSLPRAAATLTLFLAPHDKLHLRLQERGPESASVRLAASPPPTTMASSITIPDAVPSKLAIFERIS